MRSQIENERAGDCLSQRRLLATPEGLFNPLVAILRCEEFPGRFARRRSGIDRHEAATATAILYVRHIRNPSRAAGTRLKTHLCHRLSKFTPEYALEVVTHARGDNYLEDEAEEPAATDCHNDTVGYSATGVCSFLGHMDTGVKGLLPMSMRRTCAKLLDLTSDSPNRTEPGEHKSPTRRPSRQIIYLCEDKVAVTASLDVRECS